MFKTVDQFDSTKFANRFVLRNNGDSAKVIFLYRSRKEFLIADAHYIKSPEYSGYVHCLHQGCPACAKGIKAQAKIFVPLYDVETGKILFWERDTKYFLEQFKKDVLSNFENPSSYVFSITRNGEYGDRGTRYVIAPIAKNNALPYDKIVASAGVTFPEHYSAIIAEMDRGQLALALTPTSDVSGMYGASLDNLPEFTPQPRVTITPTNAPAAPAAVDVDSLPGNDDFEDLSGGDEPDFD